MTDSGPSPLPSSGPAPGRLEGRLRAEVVEALARLIVADLRKFPVLTTGSEDAPATVVPPSGSERSRSLRRATTRDRSQEGGPDVR